MPLHRPITKSDFKLALDCLLKFKHKRDGLDAGEDDDMLRLLSEGGGALEALSEALEPADFTGPQGGDETAPACMAAVREQYAKALKHGTGDPRRMREVTIVDGPFLGRLDLLRIWKDRIELVEQKSKSISASGSNAVEGEMCTSRGVPKVKSPWVPYFQDIAFQAELLRRWIRANAKALGMPPDIRIEVRLLLVNKDGTAGPDDFLQNFSADYVISGRKVRATVRHTGTPPKSSDLLLEADASKGVACMATDAQAAEPALSGAGIGECMDWLAEAVRKGAWPKEGDSIGIRCRGCEYRAAGNPDSGFVRCWGADPGAPDHILRLSRVTDDQFDKATGTEPAAKASLKVLDATDLTPGQLRQWEVARSGKPWIDPAFAADRLNGLRAPKTGPVAFLDFETVAFQIPARVGGRPYEKVPFQFEAVSLPSAASPLGDRVGHDGFLDLASADPRRDFVRALDRQLSAATCIYHWSPFERVVLESIRGSLLADPAKRPGDAELVGAIDRALPRLVDLMEIVKGAYMHPDMGGSFSIKRVLPIVWRERTIRAAFARGAAALDPIAYEARADPYESLVGLGKPFLEAIGGPAVLRRLEERDDSAGITGGGTASLYYHWARQFRRNHDPEVQRVFRDYCRLDARAMVMVFGHLRGTEGPRSSASD